MGVRDWLKRQTQDGRRRVTQIAFAGERFDVMSIRRVAGPGPENGTAVGGYSVLNGGAGAEATPVPQISIIREHRQQAERRSPHDPLFRWVSPDPTARYGLGSPTGAASSTTTVPRLPPLPPARVRLRPRHPAPRGRPGPSAGSDPAAGPGEPEQPDGPGGGQ